MELRAALVNLSREISRGCASIERVDDYRWQSICSAPITCLIHARYPQSLRIINKDDACRLIERTDFVLLNAI